MTTCSLWEMDLGQTVDTRRCVSDTVQVCERSAFKPILLEQENGIEENKQDQQITFS